MAKEIKVTQVRSLIGSLPKHRKTVKALGLKKINHTVTHQDTPNIRGMINRVNHLVKVEE